MSLRIKHMQHIILSLFGLFALLPIGPAAAQAYDQFRLVGDHSGQTTGFVTSINFTREQNQATLQYVDVAGGSRELSVELVPSPSIPSTLPVFLPTADFLQPLPSSLDLSGIDYLQGRISSSDDVQPPPHWFRLTHHNEQWSGVFRVDNRIYSIDRYSPDGIVAARAARHGDSDFLPESRIKVSAVIDELYVQPDATGDLIGMDNLGHLFALESLHILDGLLSDSLGITIRLEQLVYQSSSALSDGQTPENVLRNAETWSDNNAEAFGLTDNLATVFFRGQTMLSASGPALSANTNDHITVIPDTQHYQFATSHAFGLILGLPFEERTIQHWPAGSNDVLPDVLWSTSQKQFLDNHPLPESLVQAISSDAPEIADPTTDEPATAIDNDLVVSEQPESGELFDDDSSDRLQTDNNTGVAGSGTFAPIALLSLLLLQQFRRRYAHHTLQ